MENIETKKDNKFYETISRYKEIIKTYAIIGSALQYKKSEEIILKKVDNEKNAITYSINSINRKVLENLKKYAQVEQELNDLMEKYESNLKEMAQWTDSNIITNYTKLLEEEKKQLDMNIKIFELEKEEVKAMSKVDNSDDEIREKICNIEDEVSKIETKISRLKVTIRKKVEEKEKTLNGLMETKEQQIQRNVKGPKVFSKATRFFLGKINPYKMIEKNVFSKLRQRIEDYDKEEKNDIKKIDEKYTEENIITTIEEIMNSKVEEEQKQEEPKKVIKKRKTTKKKKK